MIEKEHIPYVVINELSHPLFRSKYIFHSRQSLSLGPHIYSLFHRGSKILVAPLIATKRHIKCNILKILSIIYYYLRSSADFFENVSKTNYTVESEAENCVKFKMPTATI